MFKCSENTPGVQGIELEKRLPCERMLISSWEQRHLCSLPEDLRQFYSSTDGFRLIWNYEYAGSLNNLDKHKFLNYILFCLIFFDNPRIEHVFYLSNLKLFTLEDEDFTLKHM